jgi:hypothetical protein
MAEMVMRTRLMRRQTSRPSNQVAFSRAAPTIERILPRGQADAPRGLERMVTTHLASRPQFIIHPHKRLVSLQPVPRRPSSKSQGLRELVLGASAAQDGPGTEMLVFQSRGST